MAKMVRQGEWTATDIISDTIQQIQQKAHLNAFITINDKALERAAQIDDMIRNGQDPGRLAGVPISIKDNICTSFMRTTCGSRMLEEFTPPYNATVVDRIISEGGIIVGKTNMDEFAMGISTEFSAFGMAHNPYRTDYVPGGSSGGSAVSLASHTSALSLGSDTGGSVRNPASFCGVVGLKPTYGTISRYGLVSYSNSIEQIGPMGRTIPDVSLLYGIICGRDIQDDTTHDISHMIDRPGLEGKRVGIVQQMMPDTIHEGVRCCMEDTIHVMEGMGATCDYVSLNMIPYAVPAYYTITSTEAASNLARYDNIRYGYDMDATGYEFHRYVAKSRERFGPEVKRRIILGGFVSSHGYEGRYFLKALGVKRRLTEQVDDTLKRYDYLISPTVPVPPFRRDTKLDDPVSMLNMDINTVTANLAGKPAISIPAGYTDGLPVGVQLMGKSDMDMDLLEAARALEQIS